jgi:hypothetical protein
VIKEIEAVIGLTLHTMQVNKLPPDPVVTKNTLFAAFGWVAIECNKKS